MNLSQLLSRYYDFFAAGDAVGKATEFMTLEAIGSGIGRIDTLLPGEKSQNHSDLESWEVTDDTEQNLYLLRRYLKDGKVAIENTVDALVHWINETGAVQKKYIGPSSLAALNSIQAGKDPLTTGLNGTTCGAIMRCPAAVFASKILNLDLSECVFYACVPTHYTSTALESAYAYAYALSAAIDGKNKDEVISQALKGAKDGIGKAPWIYAGATLCERLEFLLKYDVKKMDEQDFKRFVYGVLGTGLPSYETSAAVFAFLLYTDDPVKAIMLASETGGDTDTVAALCGSLCAMINRKTELPKSIIGPIREHNNLAVL